jgi:two-component system sensor histidine kinase/response regulator
MQKVDEPQSTHSSPAELFDQKFALDQHAIVAFTDVRGTITYVNDKFCTISQYSRDELIGQNHRILNSSHHPPGFFREMYRAVANGQTWHGEIKNRAKDGSFYWVDTTVVPTLNAEGKPNRYVAIRADITERKRLEEALKESIAITEASLKELSDQKFALDQHAIVALTDVQGTITNVNDKFCTISQYSRDELIGQNHRILNSGHHPRGFFRDMYQTIANGQVWHGEIKNRAKDGSFYWVDTTIVPLTGENGKPRQYIAIRADISVRKQAEEATRQAKVEAEEANNAKSYFLANMSHEIRTPMNAIMGMTYLALRADPAPEQRRYLGKISSAADSLLTIINDILDISKLEAGKMELESVPFSLDLLLSDINDIVIHAAKQKNLDIAFSTEQEVPQYLIGDPLRLKQILINLVNNAIKFTQAGKVFLNVSAEEVTGNLTHLSFSVSDTGVGMTAEQISRLFQPFNQADVSHTRKFGGTGLGLAISKELCHLMKGALTVESAPDKGTTFILKVELGISSKAVPRRGTDTRRHSILVADDNPGDRDTLYAMLTAKGFATKAVSSGEEALFALSLTADSRDPFDLVLMDWRMPGINGIEAARQIKSHSEWPRIPAIVIVTALDRQEVMRDASDAGLDGFLIKPVKESVLVDTIADIFDREVGVRSGTSAGGSRRGSSDGSERLVGRHVLLVEDIEVNRDLVGELLGDLGISVTMAVNGREGVEQALAGRFDLVLMDIQMPIMDGLAATRSIRADRRFSTMPIIAMTAHAMTGDRNQSLDAGMNDHLTKPINPDRLTEALLRWMPVRPAQSVTPNVVTTWSAPQG